jgi:hypothetical protein
MDRAGRVPEASRRGWLVVAAVTAVYYTALILIVVRSGWVPAWRTVLVDPMVPVFGDLAVILSGMECTRLGYDVMSANPCDYFHRQMNYPGIWMLPAPTGLGMDHLVISGVIVALLFYLGVFLLLRHHPMTLREGFFFAALLVSPSVQFGVERANNDLIIFFLVVVAILAFASSRSTFAPLSLLLVAFTGVLKLYPIAALGMALLRRGSLKLAGVIALAFGAYCLLNLDALRDIAAATPSPRSLAYGAGVLPDFVGVLGERVPALAPFVPLAQAARHVLPALILGAAFYAARRWRLEVELGTDVRSVAFMAGASIYLFTFLLGHNWDYRLIFLLLVVPRSMIWARSTTVIARVARLLLVLILAALWVSRLSHVLNHMDEILMWALFAVLTVIMAAWARQSFPVARPAARVSATTTPA